MTMLPYLKKLSTEEAFWIFVLLFTLVLGLLFGYTLFRYWQVDFCKETMKIL